MWSGGKDAALALEVLRQDNEYVPKALLTTVVEEVDTVTMHGTPLALIRAQAAALALPLHVMRVPPNPSNATYEERLERALAPLVARGLTTVATGDLFLDDIRAYREHVLRGLGATPLFPIWARDPAALVQHAFDAGYRIIVSSVDTTLLAPSFAGRVYDAAFVADLPDDVDACGEKGAFHTFVADGPIFAQPVPVRVIEQYGDGRMRYARLRSASGG